MGIGGRIRLWRLRLAALMRRVAASLEGDGARPSPPVVARPPHEPRPPAHWQARIEESGRPLAWIGPEEDRASDVVASDAASPASTSSEPSGAESHVTPVKANVRRAEPPRRPAVAARRGGTAARPTPPAILRPPAIADRSPSPSSEQERTVPSMPTPLPMPPASSAPTPPRRGPPRLFAPPPPPRKPAAPAPQPLASQLRSPQSTPAEELVQAPAPRRVTHDSFREPAEAPLRPRPVRTAAVETAPRGLSSPTRPSPPRPHAFAPGDAAPPTAHARREPADLDAPSNQRPAAANFLRTDPPRSRSSTDGSFRAPPITPPWPELGSGLARRQAEELPARPPAAAPWPELLAGDEQDAERSFEELERAARLDALAARLGDLPWNASPS